MDDRDAFFKWLNEPMVGLGYNANSRIKFAESIGASVQDLEWAFICGRNSMRKEVAGEDQVCNS